MRFSAFLLLICLFFSCDEKPAETRSEKLAKAICACSSQLMELNKQAANAPQGAIDFEGIQTAFAVAKTCIAKQHIKPEDRLEVEKQLSVQCPELAAEGELLEELIGF